MNEFVAQFDQLSTKGNFDRVDIVTALTTHKGNVELAFQELNRLQQQQFLHQVWNKQPEEAPEEIEKNVDMGVRAHVVNESVSITTQLNKSDALYRLNNIKFSTKYGEKW